MKLYEFEGKRIFKEHGIPVPKGNVLTSAKDNVEVDAPAVIKAQVLTGGRGKAGGIKIWDGENNAADLLNDIFSQELKGEPVRAVLVEEKADILQEYYLSITFKGSTATPLIVASAAGGVEIENVAAETPEKIITMEFNAITGPTDYQIRYMANKIGYENFKEFKMLINNLYTAFKSSDATLVEINPLVSTPNGLVALDAKVVLDDNARFRHEDMHLKFIKEQKSLEGIENYVEPKEDTITYVPLSGDVGLISDGAGTGMLSLDLIKDAGGEAANFCELGGITNAQTMYDSLDRVANNKNVKSILIVLIGGFNRMDDMANGIVRYKEEKGLNIPVEIRMCGTKEEEGKEIMKQANIPTFNNLLEAVNYAVTNAGGE